jgi:NADH:ubiquinone oxidoreductase subunit E
MSFNTKTIQEILKDYSKEKGNLMIVLQKIQKSCGNYLPKEAVLEVAKVTKMPLNKLYAFISFYSMFSTKKRGKHIIRVCKDGPCIDNGGREIMNLLEKELDIKFGETTENGVFTLEKTACIGTCTAAPAIMIDDEVFSNVTPDSLFAILKKYTI